MLLKVKGLALLFLCSIPVFGQTPPLEGLQTYGCNAKQVQGEWRLEVHAEYANGAEWKLQSYRSAALDRTLKACAKWMHQVEKKAKAKK